MPTRDISCRVCGRWLLAHRNGEACDSIPASEIIANLRAQLAQRDAEIARLSQVEKRWYWIKDHSYISENHNGQLWTSNLDTRKDGKDLTIEEAVDLEIESEVGE